MASTSGSTKRPKPLSLSEMTLLDFIAINAMNSILSREDFPPHEVSDWAYEYAYAMLEKRIEG